MADDIIGQIMYRNNPKMVLYVTYSLLLYTFWMYIRASEKIARNSCGVHIFYECIA